MRKHLLYLILGFLACMQGAAAEESVPSPFAEGVAIHLRNPELCEGVLTTSEGGVITAPDIRIQARCIESHRQIVDDVPIFTVRAEGDLMLQYCDHIFTGSLLQYDFQAHRGVLYDARGMFHPWYIGADYVQLLPDGNYRIHKGFLTTSPAWDPEWRLCINNAHLTKTSLLTAKNVQFQVARLPLLWIPYLQTKLNWLVDSPVRYRLRWGGQQGLRFGIIYKILDCEWFKAFFRFDYRLSRGPGAALETERYSPDGTEVFLTRNYVARDSADDAPNERLRYRVQGYYNKCLCDGQVNLNITYDKISDIDMPTDYSDKDLELRTAQRTQLRVRSQNDYGIADFRTRIRVNSFETLKEDIPFLDVNFRPFSLGPTGIISENQVQFGYHDFRFSNIQPASTDFNSTRAEFQHNLYRPIQLGFGAITPDAGVVAIYYGNSAERFSKWVTLGQFGGTAMTQMHKHYGCFKHVLEPYVRYQYFTTPNTSPDQHFIFDLQDGWFRLNTLRFGGRNLLYQKCGDGCVAHSLTLDVYAYAFFDTPTIGSTLPRIYTSAIWDVTSSFRYTACVVWNREHNILDQSNFRAQWTVNENLALDAEYRFRSSYYWRRIDPDNFLMDSFRSQDLLRNSPVSDRRSTGLLHAFYRIQPDMAVEAWYHYGWNRLNQPNYKEYQIDVLKTIRSTWHLKVSYQQRENDHRVALHIKVGLEKPECPCERSGCLSRLE